MCEARCSFGGEAGAEIESEAGGNEPGEEEDALLEVAAPKSVGWICYGEPVGCGAGEDDWEQGKERQRDLEVRRAGWRGIERVVHTEPGEVAVCVFEVGDRIEREKGLMKKIDDLFHFFVFSVLLTICGFGYCNLLQMSVEPHQDFPN